MAGAALARHYQQLIGLEAPWRVVDVAVSHAEREVRIRVERGRGRRLRCPDCGRVCSGYDSRERRWRHLDTMQYHTLLIAQVPRVDCPEHGARQVEVPWAGASSRFTALFEAVVIEWLREASVAAVARQLGLSWEQVDGIQSRAVQRGLARRQAHCPERIGVDETAFQRRHDYVTVVNDLASGTVLHVAEGRKRGALEAFYEDLAPRGRKRITEVAMDMWPAYIRATRNWVPQARIVFDKFHVAQHLGEAVDKVRRQENRALRAEGDDTLVRTKYHWLQNPDNMSLARWRAFAPLRDSRLKVARAWAIKETAMTLWGYARRGWAERRWRQWYAWAIRSRLDPIKRVARMIKKHWEGVINAATCATTNARAEGLNSKIQWIKRMACGFRNPERFRNAIYFHLGGLDLYPDGAR